MSFYPLPPLFAFRFPFSNHFLVHNVHNHQLYVKIKRYSRDRIMRVWLPGSLPLSSMQKRYCTGSRSRNLEFSRLKVSWTGFGPCCWGLHIEGGNFKLDPRIATLSNTHPNFLSQLELLGAELSQYEKEFPYFQTRLEMAAFSTRHLL